RQQSRGTHELPLDHQCIDPRPPIATAKCPCSARPSRDDDHRDHPGRLATAERLALSAARDLYRASAIGGAPTPGRRMTAERIRSPERRWPQSRVLWLRVSPGTFVATWALLSATNPEAPALRSVGAVAVDRSAVPTRAHGHCHTKLPSELE